MSPIRVLAALAMAFAGSALATPDKPGCKDHPLFPTRMPGYYLADCQSRDFDVNDLRTSGHVAVEGIYFDTGKAVVKPESKPALDEVAKLLKTDPALRLWVVGHTDAVGKVDDNMRLAQARADAVAAELVSAHGVPAVRLKGYGVGPLAPIAGNDAEDGRAKNRRVELVKQP